MSKVYVVTTIKTCESGENFTIENVFTNYTAAFLKTIELNFKYNTERYPHKDKNDLELKNKNLIEEIQRLKIIDKKTAGNLSKEFINSLDKFQEDINDKYAWDLPAFRSYVAENLLDDNTNNYQVHYDNN